MLNALEGGRMQNIYDIKSRAQMSILWVQIIHLREQIIKLSAQIYFLSWHLADSIAFPQVLVEG